MIGAPGARRRDAPGVRLVMAAEGDVARFPFHLGRDGERLVVSQSRLAEALAVFITVVTCGWLLYAHFDLRRPASWNPSGWVLSAVLVTALGYQLYRSVWPRRFTFDCAGNRLLRRDKLLCPLSHVDRLLIEEDEAKSGSGQRVRWRQRWRLLAVLKDGRRVRVGEGPEDAIDDVAWEISRFTRLPVKLE